MSAFPLPSATPASQGVDARGLLSFVDAVERDGLELHSVAVARHGHVVAAGWWSPYAPSQTPLVYSLSKSMTATAVGLLVDEGLLSVQDRLVDRLGIDPADVDPAWHEVQVRHALSMTLGHSKESVEQAQGAAARLAAENHPDPFLAGILATPPDRPAGSVFAYNQPATYLLSHVVESVTGTPLSDVLRTRLLEPLGLPPVGWEKDEAGHEIGYSGAHLPTATVLTLAQLYLSGGVVDGRRFLSSTWVEEATTGQSPPREDGETNPDWVCGYGYSFWQARHGYRGDGAFGQYAIVLPDQETAIAITSEVEDMQSVLDLLWEHVLPAVSDGAEVSAEADLALAARLSSLSLRGPGSSSPADASRVHSRPVTFGAASSGEGATGEVAGPGLPLEVASSADGWLVTIDLDDERFAVPCGDGTWLQSRVEIAAGELEVAGSGGWQPDGTFAAHLRLLDSPHTVHVVGDPATGESRVGWRTTPLFGGDLARLVV